MSDMVEHFRDLKAFYREKNAERLAKADAAGWTQHSTHHWSRTFNGKRLDYWPSRGKWMYDGKVMVGDIGAWMRKRTKP